MQDYHLNSSVVVAFHFLVQFNISTQLQYYNVHYIREQKLRILMQVLPTFTRFKPV